MIKSFIDEAEVFEVNSNLSVQVKEIGPLKRKCIVVDNFYKRPEMVRDLALMIPPTVNERILTYLPKGKTSGRINAFYLMDGLAPAFDAIYRECLPEIYSKMPEGEIYRSFRDATFMVNVMTSENLPPRVPHIDHPNPDIYAALIFLNTDDECQGGTAFYTYNNEMTGMAQYMDAAKTRYPDHFIVDDVGGWKMIELIPMKFNRMILYPQCIYHNAYIKPEMFVGDVYRLNQVFFI
jgi:hypothetical protein